MNESFHMDGTNTRLWMEQIHVTRVDEAYRVHDAAEFEQKCVCLHMYLCACVCVCVHTHIYIYIFVCMYIYIYVSCCISRSILASVHCNTLHSATHCNTPQHTATHWQILQHIVTYCITGPRTSPETNRKPISGLPLQLPLQRTATPQKYRICRCNSLRHCNTLHVYIYIYRM